MTPEKKADLETKWKTVAAQAITNDEFKKNLLQDPITILKAHGLDLPEQADVRVIGKSEVRIKPPQNSTPELDEEVRWWKVRLDMIHEFGKADPDRGVNIVAPQNDDEE